MTDQPDFELEAASAAADDVASAEERALVDASPALQAEVESIRELSAEIAAVDVPAGARDVAIAAALAVFDAGGRSASSAAAALRPSPVVALSSRRRREWGVLVGAAAAVAVLAIGAVLVTSRGGDDESSDTTSAAAVSVIPGSARTENEGQAGAPAATTPTDVDEADSQPFEDTTSEEAPLPAAAETTSLDIQVPAEVTPAIETPTELLSYASSPLTFSTPATEASDDTTAETTAATTADTTADTMAADTAPPAGDAPDTSTAKRPVPTDLCVSDGTEYVGQVRYEGVLAYVVRVLDTGEVRALAASDCRLLASATP